MRYEGILQVQLHKLILDCCISFLFDFLKTSLEVVLCYSMVNNVYMTIFVITSFSWVKAINPLDWWCHKIRWYIVHFLVPLSQSLFIIIFLVIITAFVSAAHWWLVMVIIVIFVYDIIGCYGVGLDGICAIWFFI
jgi:hypothetical protein